MKEAQIQADHDAKMKQMNLDAVFEEQQIKLKQKAEMAKLQLQREIEIEKANLARDVAEAEHGIRREYRLALGAGVIEQRIGQRHRLRWQQPGVRIGRIGLLDPAGLPVAGVETAKKVADKSLPSNTLMKKWAASAGKPI